MVQKATRVFQAHILPKQGAERIRITYELLARDYNREGELEIVVEPKFDERRVTELVDSEPVPEDQITIEKKLE